MINKRIETYKKVEDIKPKRDAGTCDFDLNGDGFWVLFWV
jgi:hypothetical protein